MWDALLKKYEKANVERKHQPELKEAMTLWVENVRVPLPTAIQRNRNMNPPPVSTTFGTFESNDSLWDVMMNELKPRVLELLGGYALIRRPPPRVHRLLLIHHFAATVGFTGTSSVPCKQRPSAGTTTARWSEITRKPVSLWVAALPMITCKHAQRIQSSHI